MSSCINKKYSENILKFEIAVVIKTLRTISFGFNIRFQILHLANTMHVFFQPTAFIEDVQCSNFDSEYIETFKCWLEPDLSGHHRMNLLFVLNQDASYITCKYKFVFERQNRNITLLSMDIDVCNTVGTAFNNRVLNIITSEIYRISNIPLKCPIKKVLKRIDCEYIN